MFKLSVKNSLRDRIIIADSTALTVLQEKLDLSSNTIFNRLVNAASSEISALKIKIQSDLKIARALVGRCETLQPLFSGCQNAACCIGNESGLESLLLIYSQINFFAHQLAAQFEEIAATLTLLQEKVGHLACHNSIIRGVGLGHFTKQDSSDLEYGVQRLRGCRRRIASSSFLRHFDNFGVQPPFPLNDI